MIGLSIGINKSINATDEVRALDAIRRNGGTVLRAGLIRNYFDSAGTTAATVDNPVGLVLDAAGTVGPERRQDFVTGVGGTATAATYDTATGAGSVTRVDLSNQSFVRITGLTASKYYRLSIANTGAVTVNIRQLDYAGSTVATVAAGASGECVFTGNANCVITAAGGTATFTLNEFRELTGNHATQPTTGSKPTLRRDAIGRYYWQFDPAAPGDYLQCPVSSVGSGETLIVGCTPTGGAGTVRAAMVRRDDTAKTGMMIYADAANTWQLLSGNTVGFVATPFGGPATLNVPVVLSAVCSGNTATPYLNGVAGTPATSLAPVASVSTPLYLGALGGTFPFWGGESIAVRCPVAMPDADRRLVERWVGSLQGQTL